MRNGDPTPMVSGADRIWPLPLPEGITISSGKLQYSRTKVVCGQMKLPEAKPKAIGIAKSWAPSAVTTAYDNQVSAASAL